MHLRKLSPISSLCLLILVVVLLVGCNPQSKKTVKSQEIEPVSKTAFLMGTIVKITIFDEVNEVDPIFQQAFDRISEIEGKMTINEDDLKSEIMHLNHEAGKEYVEMSPETFYVLEKGKYYSEISHGKYDITIGPLVKLWNIGSEDAGLPEEIEIKNTLPLVNYKNLETG